MHCRSAAQCDAIFYATVSQRSLIVLLFVVIDTLKDIATRHTRWRLKFCVEQPPQSQESLHLLLGFTFLRLGVGLPHGRETAAWLITATATRWELGSTHRA